MFPALAVSCYRILHAQETCQLDIVPAVPQQEECHCSLHVLLRVDLAGQGVSQKPVNEKSKHSRWKPATGSKKSNFSVNSPLFPLLCYLGWIFFPLLHVIMVRTLVSLLYTLLTGEILVLEREK